MGFQPNLLLTEDAARRRKTRRLLAGLAYAGALLCLLWVFRGADFRTFVHQFRILKPAWLCLAICFNVAVYFTNASRWSILVSPLARVRFRKVIQAVYIGLYLNELLPLRPGELIRCYLLSRWGSLPLSNTLASAGVERLLDGLLMLAGIFIVALTTRLPGSLKTGTLILTACIAVITALWIVHIVRGRTRRRAVSGSAEMPSAGFLDALLLMGNVRVVAGAAAVSCLSMMSFILSMWFLMKASGFDLPLTAAAAVFLIIRVGTLIPNAPGNIGSYQFFCVLAMGLFGVHKSAAAAFSVLTFSVFSAPLLIGGAIAFGASGLSFRALFSRDLSSAPAETRIPTGPAARPAPRDGHASRCETETLSEDPAGKHIRRMYGEGT